MPGCEGAWAKECMAEPEHRGVPGPRQLLASKPGVCSVAAAEIEPQTSRHPVGAVRPHCDAGAANGTGRDGGSEDGNGDGLGGGGDGGGGEGLGGVDDDDGGRLGSGGGG